MTEKLQQLNDATTDCPAQDERTRIALALFLAAYTGIDTNPGFGKLPIAQRLEREQFTNKRSTSRSKRQCN